MNSSNLAEIGARLEEAVQREANTSMTPLELYQCYEMTAIQILDSQFHQFPGDALQDYLMRYLEQKRGELGVAETELN